MPAGRVGKSPAVDDTGPPRPLEAFFVLRQAAVPGQPPQVMASLPLAPEALLDTYKALNDFCFPEKPGTVDGGEVHFTFVLTREDGQHKYGHCVRTVNAEVLCIISRFAWCRLFRDLMFRYRANGEDTTLIRALMVADVPEPGRLFMLRPPAPTPKVCTPTSDMGRDGAATGHHRGGRFPSGLSADGPAAAEHWDCAATADGSCPPPAAAAGPSAAPARGSDGRHAATSNGHGRSRGTHRPGHAASASARHRDFAVDVSSVALRRPPDGYNPFVDAHPALLLRWMDANTLLSTMAALLTERHVVIVGPDVGTVSSVILALLSLLRPFEWPHVLLPIVPYKLLDMLAVPSPSLMGLLTPQLPDVPSLPGIDVVVVQLRGSAIDLDALASSSGVPGSGASCSSDSTVVSRGSSSLFSDREGGFSAPLHSTIESRVDVYSNMAPEDAAETMTVPTLPWTEFPLCAMRLAIVKAKGLLARRGKRRKGQGHSAAAAALTLEADRVLLNEFLDYYVHIFGRCLCASYNPVTFIQESLERESRRSEKELSLARDFYTTAMTTVVVDLLRRQYSPALQQAETAAASARIQTLAGQLPEVGGFADAVLLAHPDLFPSASELAVIDLKRRETAGTAERATLVTLSAPFWSLRSLGRMCSYGMSATIKNTLPMRTHTGNGSRELESTSSSNFASPPLSPAR